MKKQENESSKKVLEAVKCLFNNVSISIPDAFIDCAHRVSRTDDTVTVCFTTFCHCTTFYRKRKESKNWVKVYLHKNQIRPTDQSEKNVNSLSNIGFIYAYINFRLKIHFSNNIESFFDSMIDSILKTEGFPNEI